MDQNSLLKKIKKPPIEELRKLESKILNLYPDLGLGNFNFYPTMISPSYKDRFKPLYGVNILICGDENNFEALCKNFNNIILLLKEFLIAFYPDRNFYCDKKNVTGDSFTPSDINSCKIKIKSPKLHKINDEMDWYYGSLDIIDLAWVPYINDKSMYKQVLNNAEIKKLFYDFYEAIKVDQTCNHKRASDLFLKRISEEYKIIKN